MNEKQLAEFERVQADKYRLDATQILWMAQQEGLLREDYVSAVDVVQHIIDELKRTRAELARAERVNVELDRRLKEAACENVKMRARLVEIHKRERATRGEYERGYADGAASALVEATREMEW